MNPNWAYDILYKDPNHKDREVLEQTISESAEYSCLYAEHVIVGRFVLGEYVISKDAEYSYEYAKYVLKSRFILGEPAICKSSEYSCLYAEHVIGGRFELGEAAISKEAELSYDYAKYVIRGSWTQELAVMCPCWLFFYAKDVSKGRLPKAMHNKMLVFGMIDSSDKYVKKYLAKKLKNDSRNSV